MAAFEFNVALGREVELYERVRTNDPANSAIIMMLLALSGLETDSVLKDKDTFAAVVSGTTNEITNGGYARKTLTDASLSAYTLDDDEDAIKLVLPPQTFTAILAGDTPAKVVLGYDSDTTAGTDANIVPISAHDLWLENVPGNYITPSGDDIFIDFSSAWITAR